ncbi:HNH endonuclease signature motif containing protein, partial [Cryobacterium fucosi]
MAGNPDPSATTAFTEADAGAGSGADSGLTGAVAGAAVAGVAELSPVQRLAALQATVVAALAAVPLAGLSDVDSVAVLTVVEGLGRSVDAARVAVAAEVGGRAAWIAPGHSQPALPAALGCRDGLEVIVRATRISVREAKRRSRLGGFVSARIGVGVSLAPFYPAVAAALTGGDLGVEAAEVIVAGLEKISARVAPDDLHTAERALVACATGAVTEETRGLPGEGLAFGTDILRGIVLQWQARLDPDGTAPTEPVLEGRSTFGFGTLKDGLYPLRGGVTPELRGIMNVLFDTYLSARAAPAFPTPAEQARIDGGALVPGAEAADAAAGSFGGAGDDRTGGEKRADIVHAVFERAARDPGTPTLGGAAPTVLVHVNAADLQAGTGVGWIDGVQAPISLTSVTQRLCAGGSQTVLFGPNQEVLRLGLKERFFSRAQRRAIAARDGGCIIPGCTSPPHWAELHHVIPWWAGGLTDIDNGVMLCWFHHHYIDRDGWKIR